MSTRSDIIVRLSDGSWKRIYCHSDGYLSHNGVMLYKHYNSQERAESLAALGDLSFLAPEIGEKHDFNYHQNLYHKHDGNWDLVHSDPEFIRLENMCKVYGRDRGEADTQGVTGETLESVWPAADCWTGYTYVWNGKKWQWTNPRQGPGTLRDLFTSLKAEAAEEMADTVEPDETVLIVENFDLTAALVAMVFDRVFRDSMR